MVKSIGFTFLLFLCNIKANSQTLGQTKVYLIKEFETCKIIKNLPDFLAMECDGIETSFLFDENHLSKVHQFELLVSDWNDLQVKLMWNDAKCIGKSIAPSPKKENMKLNVLIYSDDQYDYYFFDSDFDGNKDALVKSVAIKKHQ